MSFEIQWETILKTWLDPEKCCTLFTDKINSALPANAPISNFRVTNFDLTACSEPTMELCDFTDIRDDFLLALGKVRDIRSPPPSEAFVDSTAHSIDAGSFLFDGQRGLGGESLKSTIVRDGFEAIFQVSFKDSRLRIEFEADAALHVPVVNFLALPLKFTLTRLDLACKVVIALDSTLDRIFLALPEPPSELDFQLAVDVGDPDKHVLRNVAKIEKFCLEQIKVILSEHLLLPRFVEFPLSNKKYS
jgi:hypothetical protein